MGREYHQFCGLAHALEILGGRWTVLVVRDLLGGPKRFTELQAGLPGIPTNVLSARLRDLEEAGVVRRKVQPRPATGVAYELTEYGLGLEAGLVQLGLWGMRSMGPRRDGDFLNMNALALALRGVFQPPVSKGLTEDYEVVIDGLPLRVAVADGRVSFPAGTSVRPHASISGGHQAFYRLFTGQMELAAAAESGEVEVTGNLPAARRFFQMFRMAAPVEPQTAQPASVAGAGPASVRRRRLITADAHARQ